MKRKFGALFLAVALAFSLAACGNDSGSNDATGKSTQTEENTPAEESTPTEDTELPEAEASEGEEAQPEIDPMAEALKNMDAVTSMEAKIVLDENMKISADGQEQSIETTLDMDMVWFKDPLKIKVDMNVEAAGENTQISIYAEPAEDGTYTMYQYDGENWQSQPASAEDLEGYSARSTMVDSIGDGSVYKVEGTEQVDGANAYKYSYVMTEDETKEALLSSGALDSVSSLGIDESQLESMVDGLGEITTYIWVDEATLYPVKYEMDMTDVMDALMVKLIEAMGEQAEGMTLNMPKMKLSMTCSNFNSAADFTIPDEAKANN